MTPGWSRSTGLGWRGTRTRLRPFEQIALEILAEASATDEAEDESMVISVVRSCPSSYARRRADASSSADAKRKLQHQQWATEPEEDGRAGARGGGRVGVRVR